MVCASEKSLKTDSFRVSFRDACDFERTVIRDGELEADGAGRFPLAKTTADERQIVGPRRRRVVEADVREAGFRRIGRRLSQREWKQKSIRVGNPPKPRRGLAESQCGALMKATSMAA